MNKYIIIMIAYHESMTKPRFVRDSVVKRYLNGKSYAEISNENNIAKGSVFNIINT
jgi:DNA-directed RNA polymerase specialized sigma24 family protein